MKRSQKKTRKRNSRGAIPFIVGLLLASAVIRLGTGPALAIAKDASLFSASGEEENAHHGSEMADRSEKDLSAMLMAFEKREAKIAEQERQIALRLQALKIADQEIEKRMAALKDAEEKLRSTLALADSAAEDDLARLTSVYENMKPKDSAALFETMEPAFAAGFLGRMRPEAAAGIMASLSPQAAYTISVILAGRNANVPKG